MGLDIYAYKIVDHPSEDYFSLIDDNGYYDNREFPNWTKRHEKTKMEKWFDWDKYKKMTGIDMNECEIACISYGYMIVKSKSDISLYKKHKSYRVIDYFGEKRIKIYTQKVPTKRIGVKVIYRKEVGYQRKGFNNTFYEDMCSGKISNYVFDKETLLSYKEKYCKEDYKEYFQKWIIDKFIDGKCIVFFSW